MSTIKKISPSKLVFNPDNPRLIRDEKFLKLKKSIADFPDMLDKRFFVVDEALVVLGGNQRLKAVREVLSDLKESDTPDYLQGKDLEELKEIFSKVPYMIAEGWSEAQKREFVIKDNISYGEYDWQAINDSWDIDEIKDWGETIDFEGAEDGSGEEDEQYTKKIEAPIYEPTGDKPSLDEIYDNSRTLEIIGEIDSSNAPKEVKEFLRICAQRHTVINYERVAEYYAQSDAEIQNLIESQALVIIDFDKAIEGGFIEMSNAITEQFLTEHGDE